MDISFEHCIFEIQLKMRAPEERDAKTTELLVESNVQLAKGIVLLAKSNVLQ